MNEASADYATQESSKHACGGTAVAWVQHLLDAESAMRGMAVMCSWAEMLPACSQSRFICMMPKMRSCLLKVSSFSSRPAQPSQRRLVWRLAPVKQELAGTLHHRKGSSQARRYGVGGVDGSHIFFFPNRYGKKKSFPFFFHIYFVFQ